MSKIKKKIKEYLGFNGLNREEEIIRAFYVLNNNDLKQQICNQIQGLSFKDIDKVMEAILNNSSMSMDEIRELYEAYKEKIELDMPHYAPQQTQTNKKKIKYYNPSPEEVQRLLEASREQKVDKPIKSSKKHYINPSIEEASALVSEYLEYLKSKKTKV